jgi:hypothetical protein
LFKNLGFSILEGRDGFGNKFWETVEGTTADGQRI